MAEDDDDSTLNESEFHNLAQKQIMNVVFSTLAEAKMDWKQIEPFLEAARSVCLGDFTETARVRLHTMRAEGEGWVEAEEAYLGISVTDRESGAEWLSDSWWLSDLATADGDRTEVQAIVAALERTIAKLNAWLESGGDEAAGEEAAGDEAEAPPPAPAPEEWPD
jgi:hypothetical protein